MLLKVSGHKIHIGFLHIRSILQIREVFFILNELHWTQRPVINNNQSHNVLRNAFTSLCLAAITQLRSTEIQQWTNKMKNEIRHVTQPTMWGQVKTTHVKVNGVNENFYSVKNLNKQNSQCFAFGRKYWFMEKVLKEKQKNPEKKNPK